jgi:hypothetical protein
MFMKKQPVSEKQGGMQRPQPKCQVNEGKAVSHSSFSQPQRGEKRGENEGIT